MAKVQEHPEEEVEKDEDEEDKWWEDGDKEDKETNVTNIDCHNQETKKESKEEEVRRYTKEMVTKEIKVQEIKLTKTKDAATDPWQWRGLPTKKKEEREKQNTAQQTLEDFVEDDTLNGFEKLEEEEDDGEICNFDLDLYSGDF